MCLVVSNGLGITEEAERVPAVVVTDIDASKLVPGQKRRNYSCKAIATLIATGMGKLASL